MKINRMLKIVALSCLTGAMLASTLVRADDEADKLKALERAMTASPVKKPVGKTHTRAIVFDADPQADAPQAPAPQAPQAGAGQAQAPQVQAPAVTAVDCGMPTPDAKITAVEFAIQFKVGSASLTAPSENTLKQIAKILTLSNNCILVEGHTDSAGNAERNLELSRQRADTVARFITGEAGIAKSRLVPVGKGSSEPIKDLDSRNPMNRRVVFKVVG